MASRKGTGQGASEKPQSLGLLVVLLWGLFAQDVLAVGAWVWNNETRNAYVTVNRASSEEAIARGVAFLGCDSLDQMTIAAARGEAPMPQCNAHVIRDECTGRTEEGTWGRDFTLAGLDSLREHGRIEFAACDGSPEKGRGFDGVTRSAAWVDGAFRIVEDQVETREALPAPEAVAPDFEITTGCRGECSYQRAILAACNAGRQPEHTVPQPELDGMADDFMGDCLDTCGGAQGNRDHFTVRLDTDKTIPNACSYGWTWCTPDEDWTVCTPTIVTATPMSSTRESPDRRAIAPDFEITAGCRSECLHQRSILAACNAGRQPAYIVPQPELDGMADDFMADCLNTCGGAPGNRDHFSARLDIDTTVPNACSYRWTWCTPDDDWTVCAPPG